MLVTSLYEQFGQVPAQLFQMRPFGMVLAGRTAGIIEASLVQRPGEPKIEEENARENPAPLIRIRVRLTPLKNGGDHSFGSRFGPLRNRPPVFWCHFLDSWRLERTAKKTGKNEPM